MTSEPASDAWIVYEFVDRFVVDLERGNVRPVEHYLTLFPGHDEVLRSEYDDLVRRQRAREERARDAHASPPERPRVGPYRLLSEIGRGGQARVWLAEDTRLARRVALKVLGAPLIGASSVRRERFRREAEVVARLEHPGICGVLEADLEAETPWIAMPFVQGETLATVLARERAELEPAQARHPLRGARLAARLLFFERAARALHAAHEAGVVHRDVKPGNLMVTGEGLPVLLDFGLAQDDSDPSGLTRTGEVFGTPAYMAPEQIAGRAVDRRTDVHALAVVLYEAVTLRRPFEGPGTEALARAIQGARPPDPAGINPALPRDLGVVLATALEKQPERRYGSALELAEELRRVREFEPIRARPVGALGRLLRWSQRHPWVAASTGGSIVLLSAALVAALLFIDRLRDEQLAKERALGEKQAALDLYEGGWFRDLAASRLEVSPASSLRVAIAAAERDPGLASNQALLRALAELRERATLSGHTDLLTQLDVDRAGRTLVTTALDGSARLWDARTGAEHGVCRAHAGAVWSARFDMTGERLVTAGADGTACIFRVADPGRAPIVLRGHDDEVHWAEFSADGTRVVTAGRDHTARIWNAADGSQELVLRGHTGNLSWARFLDAGRLVLTASGEPRRAVPAPESDRSLHLFDARTGTELATLVGHEEAIVSVAVAPDERSVASTSDDRSVRVWELAPLPSGRCQTARVLRFPGKVHAASFSPDGTLLAVAFDAGASVFDVASLRTRYELPDHDHRAVVDVSFSADGRALATAAFDNTLRVFDARDGRPLVICRSQSRPQGVRWAPDGSWLASWYTIENPKLWYAGARPFLPVLGGDGGALRCARFDPVGARIVTAAADGRARLYDARSGALQGTLDSQAGAQRRAALLAADFDALGVHVLTTAADGSVRLFDAGRGTIQLELAGWPSSPVASFSPDGLRILSVASRAELELHEIAAGTSSRLASTRGSIVCACFAPDGERIACGTDERCVCVWDLRAPAGGGPRTPTWTFGPYETQNHKLTEVLDVRFDPRGRRLAATAQNVRTYLFDAATGTELAHDDNWTMGQLRFTPDGRYLFGAGKWTGYVRAWELAPEGQPAAWRTLQLRDVPAWVKTTGLTSLCAAPRSNLVVAGSLDRTAKLWDLDQCACVAIYPGHADAVWDVAFAPDGESFVTASGDGTARIWPVDLLGTARRWLPPGQSASERQLPRPEQR